MQDGPQRASKFLQKSSKRPPFRTGYLRRGILAMLFTKRLRQYSHSVRARLGDRPDRTYFFELLLFLLLIGLLVLGIAWM